MLAVHEECGYGKLRTNVQKATGGKGRGSRASNQCRSETIAFLLSSRKTETMKKFSRKGSKDNPVENFTNFPKKRNLSRPGPQVSDSLRDQ